MCSKHVSECIQDSLRSNSMWLKVPSSVLAAAHKAHSVFPAFCQGCVKTDRTRWALKLQSPIGGSQNLKDTDTGA